MGIGSSIKPERVQRGFLDTQSRQKDEPPFFGKRGEEEQKKNRPIYGIVTGG